MFSCSLTRRISFAWMAMSLAWPEYPPETWWTMMRLCGSTKRWPGAPPHSSSEPIDAAWPRQMVVTGDRMYCIVS